jgi:excinuclease UvrABC ATPase subunit
MSIKLMDFLLLSPLNKDHQQSPRSTVGTITEIYDFVYFMHVPRMPIVTTQEKMVSYSDELKLC